MQVTELRRLLVANSLTSDKLLQNTICSGYVCDLLSWVMAKGERGAAWVTVQTHINVVAVASLHEMACIILPEGITMEEAPLQKAEEEGIAVLSSPLSAYEICGRMLQNGIPAPKG